jgi:hypothetical protein
MKTQFTNDLPDGPEVARRRIKFNSAVRREMRETGLDYNSAFAVVLCDPQFAELCNDCDTEKSDADLRAAGERNRELQVQIRDMMKRLNMPYDQAFRLVWGDPKNKELISKMRLPRQSDFLQFNYQRPLMASKTDYNQQAGIRRNAEPMERALAFRGGVNIPTSIAAR